MVDISVLLLLGLCCSVGVSGYGLGGPPASACSSMFPNGHFVQGQDTHSPYSVVLSKNTYSPGEQITVTIQASDSKTFKGFFIQPRPDRDTYETYGTFNKPSRTEYSCKNQGKHKSTALSHGFKTRKTNATMIWTAPDDYQGDIVFVFTVVQWYEVFWVKQVSEVVKYKAPPPTITTTTTTTTTTTPAPTTTAATTTEKPTTTTTTTKVTTTTTLTTATTSSPKVTTKAPISTTGHYNTTGSANTAEDETSDAPVLQRINTSLLGLSLALYMLNL